MVDVHSEECFRRKAAKRAQGIKFRKTPCYSLFWVVVQFEFQVHFDGWVMIIPDGSVTFMGIRLFLNLDS